MGKRVLVSAVLGMGLVAIVLGQGAGLCLPSSPCTAGLGSVAIYPTASAPYLWNIAIGDAAQALAVNAIAIGPNTRSGDNSTVSGFGAIGGATSVISGSGADGGASGSEDVMLGDDCKTHVGAALVAASVMGRGCQASHYSAGVGWQVRLLDNWTSALGADSEARYWGSIALGGRAKTTRVSQLMVGSHDAPIQWWNVGNGEADAAPVAFTFKATDGLGANIVTPDLNWDAGRSTGTAQGGCQNFRTSSAGLSGSTANGSQTRLTICNAVMLVGATDSKPACTAIYAAGSRFPIWVVRGGTGVKDTMEVCAKDASDVYAWRTLY